MAPRDAISRALYALPLVADILLGCSGTARAQTTGSRGDEFSRRNNIGVRDRARPGYEAVGVTLGAFRLYPRFSLSANTTDNVYATETGRLSDGFLDLSPGFSLESLWGRHMLTVSGDLTQELYVNQTSENNTQGRLSLDGRYDVDRGTDIRVNAGYRRATESRSSPGSPFYSRDPVQFDEGAVSIDARRAVGRVRAQAGVRYTDVSYMNTLAFNGGPVFNDANNHGQTSLSGRLEYAYSPAIAVFVASDYNTLAYDRARNSFDRDSNGWTVTTGANFDITKLIRGELGVGYLRQSYSVAQAKDDGGLAVRGRVDYFPTTLTTVSFDVERSVRPSNVFQAPSSLYTNGSVRVDHELLRNLLLNVSAGYDREDYSGIDRSDRRWRVGVGADYFISRSVGVQARYIRQEQSSSGADRAPNFGENRLTVALTLQL